MMARVRTHAHAKHAYSVYAVISKYFGSGKRKDERRAVGHTRGLGLTWQHSAAGLYSDSRATCFKPCVKLVMRLSFT